MSRRPMQFQRLEDVLADPERHFIRTPRLRRAA